MSDLNVRVLIREVLHTTELADPTEVAAEVFSRIEPADYGEALRQVLRQTVRQVMAEDRMTRGTYVEEPDPEPKAHADAPVVAAADAGRRRVTASLKNSARSAKVTAIRNGREAILALRIHGHGRWTLLADATFADLNAAAEERRALAERNHASARVFERFAEAVREHGVDRFGDLPGRVLDLLLAIAEVAA